MEKRKERSAKVLAPVVQNVDKAIRWLNLYVVDNAISFPITLIHWIVIYPVDSSIHRLNNQSLREIISFSSLRYSLSRVPMGKNLCHPVWLKTK